MSLQIWLPLNGDYRNYGLSNLTFSNADTAITTISSGNGKTCPNCIYQNALNGGGLVSNSTINLGTNLSMFAWVKFSTVNSSSSLSAIGGQHRYPVFTGMGITMKYVSSTTAYLSVNTGNGTARTYNYYCGSTLLQANTWYHLGFTYDGATIKLYVNGVLDGSHAYTGQKNVADYIGVNAWSFKDSTITNALHSGYRTICCMNDFRVYDHCLSAKEVKILGQGLVAHYKLDGGGGNNLLLNTCNPSSTNNLASVPNTCSIEYDDVLHLNVFKSSTTSTGETYIYSSRTPVIKKSTKYTFSCDILVNDYVKSIEFFWLSDTDATTKTGSGYVNVTNASQSIKKRNEWFHLEWTFTTKSDDRTGYIRIDNNGSTASGTEAIMKVTNLKLELGDTASPFSVNINESGLSLGDDSSGYNNHGTVVGNFVLEQNSPRHICCAVFDGSTTKIELPIKSLMQTLLKDKCTINFWVNEADTSSRSVYFGGYSGSNFNIEMESAKFRVYWNGSPDLYCASGSISNNTWAMFTVVTDIKTGIKVYKNGELLKSHSGALTDITTGFTNNTFRIGSDSRTGATMMEGKMSDFRIYCSALSANDIKNLYLSSGSVTKQGGLVSYDIVENFSANAKMQKNGVFVSKDFSERGYFGNTKYTTLPDGSSWVRIFYHKNEGGTVLFKSYDEIMYSNTENKYSRLKWLPDLKGSNSKYEFMLTYPIEFAGQYNRWKQTNAPQSTWMGNSSSTIVATGYEAIHIDWSDHYWGGLGRQNEGTQTITSTFIDGSIGHTNWFYAIGATSDWNGGIPGPKNGIPVSETELWLRLDTIPENTRLKIIKERYTTSSLIQEY